MLTENDVVQAVVQYLAGKGYWIERALTTWERGVDLVALHSETQRPLLVEAKGSTSSKPGTKRHGKAFSPNQVKTHVSVALYYAVMLQQKHAAEGAAIAIALPDDERHRDCVAAIRSALEALGISVFLVSGNGQVTSLFDPS